MRYCQYFNAENTVGANSLHYNSGDLGFHFTNADIKPFRNEFNAFSAVEIGKNTKYETIEPIVIEAIKNSYDYTMVEANLKYSDGSDFSRIFILVKADEHARWRVCWMG